MPDVVNLEVKDSFLMGYILWNYINYMTTAEAKE